MNMCSYVCLLNGGPGHNTPLRKWTASTHLEYFVDGLALVAAAPAEAARQIVTGAQRDDTDTWRPRQLHLVCQTHGDTSLSHLTHRSVRSDTSER